MTAVVIVEDFPPVARGLARMIGELLPNAETTIFPRIAPARQHLENERVDLLLLDLNLGGHDGFSLLQETTSHACHTIVVSANTDRAMEAFEYGVLDFVPKPVKPERLQKALDRLSPGAAAATAPLRFFSVRKRGEICLIPVAEVVYIKGAGKYSELTLHKGNTELHDKPLERLTQLLTPHFVRIHKSYLVDVKRLQRLSVKGGGKYEAILTTGEVLPVGRSRYGELRDLLV